MHGNNGYLYLEESMHSLGFMSPCKYYYHRELTEVWGSREVYIFNQSELDLLEQRKYLVPFCCIVNLLWITNWLSSIYHVFYCIGYKATLDGASNKPKLDYSKDYGCAEHGVQHVLRWVGLGRRGLLSGSTWMKRQEIESRQTASELHRRRERYQLGSDLSCTMTVSA